MTTRQNPHWLPLLDSVPELTHYEDKGCMVWPACLSCPLARCIYDDPRGTRAAIHRPRDREIARLHAEGWAANAIARHFNMSRRQVFRVLARERDPASS